jgi:asparagine synthase (glutamine-hydrolysing)
MCGICGVAGLRKPKADAERTVIAMRESLVRRGPDDSGAYVDDGIALGIRRLAVLDLSPQGHMPMWSADGRYCIVHNGEIYNFLELRQALESKGVRFRSRSDTEVILELFAREGAAMLPRLNGMFAFAIWDTEEHALFIARDRLGIKPLYYAWHDGALHFGSEQKALFAGGVPKSFDDSTWEELLCFRFTAGERTPLTGVKRLLPGHTLTWRDGRITTERWWNLAERARSKRASNGATDAWFTETFDSAVTLRRISDVPVGLLLSGGLDSSAVAASLAEQTHERTDTFTVGFGSEGYDESALARQVAKRCGFTYHDLIVPADALLSDLRAASVLRDEPLAHVNELHLWRISAMAKPLVTVLLSGEGADETLGGYVRYQPLRFLPELYAARGAIDMLARLPFGHRVEKMARFVDLQSADDFVLYNACEVLPPDLQALGMEPGDPFTARREILAEARALYADEPVRQAMYLDQHAFLCSLLDRNDRMTMGASIECRVPFLDYRLVERLASVPSSLLFSGIRGKAISRRVSQGRLPAAVLAHKKWGFGVPWDKYFREVPELRQLIGMLPALEPIRSGPFARKRVRAVVDGFLRGAESNNALIFQLAMIAIWHDAYVAA